MEARPDLRVAHLARDEEGVLSVDELSGCGLSRDAIATRARRGQLFPRHKGVYAIGREELSFEGEMLGAVKACGPDAFLGRYSASMLWNMLEYEQRVIDVLVIGSALAEHAGIRAFR